ncbi:MAG: SMC-Scp complex subunit ScpB [Candidatus Micrarchaeota archaeon]|nr:SMC-Scp complex subunit ScpB [Candidatus Micrarchaeota archaeon]
MEGETEYKKLVEAALFMSQSALSINDIAAATGIGSPGIVERIVAELANDYKGRDTALEILSLNNKYMFSLKDPYAGRVSSLAKGPDISRGALKVLAYISKNKNVLQSDLVKYFGSSTYEYIKELSEKEFIEAAKYKRSKKITTSPKFDEYFSVSQ